VRGDDDDRRIGVQFHDPGEVIEAFAAIGGRALEIEIQQNRVRRFLFQEGKQVPGRIERFDAFEDVAQGQARGERDIRVVVHDHSQFEFLVHATSVA